MIQMQSQLHRVLFLLVSNNLLDNRNQNMVREMPLFLSNTCIPAKCCTPSHNYIVHSRFQGKTRMLVSFLLTFRDVLVHFLQIYPGLLLERPTSEGRQWGPEVRAFSS